MPNLRTPRWLLLLLLVHAALALTGCRTDLGNLFDWY